MKINQLTTLSLALVCVMFGCSGEGTDPGDSSGSDDPDDANTALQGTWVDACEAENASVHSQSSLIISGNEFTQHNTFYTADTCAPNAIGAVASISGSFIEGETTETERGTHTAIDITFSSQTETWYLSADIEALNADEKCGISNWEAGVSFDVTNCEDAVNYVPMPITLYDIYLISGNDVYFGASGAGTSRATRPTDVSTEIGFTRQ